MPVSVVRVSAVLHNAADVAKESWNADVCEKASPKIQVR